MVTNNKCSDNQKYSWQVAPLQSLLPLLTGGAKVIQSPTNRCWKSTNF